MEETKKYIMIRTTILCPNCFKKKLIEETKDNLYCDECGTEFLLVSENTVRYK